jgi:peptide-methionine (S)-S-oxide reductase
MASNRKTSTSFALSRRHLLGALAVVLVAGAAVGLRQTASRADESAVLAPAPAVDQPLAAGAQQTAVLSGGCFWGVQGVYQHVKGVSQVLSGYAGGDKSTAIYEMVGTGQTGHAESVQIKFDPAQISYGQILRIFFSVAHDPTELNRQGPDEGTQYRSAIFYADAEQKRIAEAYIAQLDGAKIYGGPIVTRVDPAKGFYPAEDYHQDFLVRNPTYPYIVINDLPKVANLQRLFPDLYRDQPVTVAATQ